MSTRDVVAGNVYDKYGTRNPIARRLMAGFERGMQELLAQADGVGSVLEVGCGEGEVTHRLGAWFPAARVRGTDLSEEIVAEARRRYPESRFDVLSVYDAPGPGGPSDLVVATEVLEHLDHPVEALRAIRRAATRYVFVSVPREPLWRALNMARGKYLGDLGNTPGHLQHWSRRSFLRFLETELEILDVRSPLPWTQALCRPRG